MKFSDTMNDKLHGNLERGKHAEKSLTEATNMETEFKKYLHKINTLNISPIALSMFVGHTPYQNGGMCHWSNAPVNHRSVLEVNLRQVFNKVLVNDFDPTSSNISIFAYAVDSDVKEDVVVDKCCVRDACDYQSKMVDPTIIVSLDYYKDQLFDFFQLVTGVKYTDYYKLQQTEGEETDINLNYSIVFFRTLQHLHTVTNGFARRSDVEWYYKKLLDFINFHKDLDEWNTEKKTYHELLLMTIQLQQSIFPFRISAIDGNHRITCIQQLLYAHSSTTYIVPQNTVINLEQLTIPATVTMWVGSYQRNDIYNIPKGVMEPCYYLSQKITNEIGMAMDISINTIMISYLNQIKELKINRDIRKHDPSIPSDFCPQLYPPFARLATINDSQVVKTVEEMDLRIPRGTYLTDYNGEDLQLDPSTPRQQNPPNYTDLVRSFDERTVTPEKVDEKKRAQKNNEEYDDSTPSGFLKSTLWLYGNSEMSKAKRHSVFNSANILRVFLENSKHLKDDLIGDVSKRLKDKYSTNEGMVGHCVRNFFSRSFFCTYNADIGSTPKYLMSYTLFLVAFVFNNYTKDLMLSLLQRCFIPSIFAQLYLRKHIHDSKVYEGFPLPQVKPFMNLSKKVFDFEFIQNVFAFPVSKIVDALSTHVNMEKAIVSRNIVKEEFNMRFYRMVAWEWLKIIKFFGYILPLYNGLEPFVGEDGIPQLHELFKDNDVTNIQVFAEIFQKHIEKGIFIEVSLFTLQFVVDFCYIKDLKKEKQKTKKKKSVVVVVGQQDQNKPIKKSTSVGINNMFGKGRYTDGTYLTFNIHCPPSDDHPQGITLQHCTLFQVFCFYVTNTVYKENNFLSTDKTDRRKHPADVKHFSEATEEEYFKEENIIYQNLNLSLDNEFQIQFSKPWLQTTQEQTARDKEEEENLLSHLTKTVKTYLVKGTVKGGSSSNEKIDLNSTSLAKKDNCNKVLDRLTTIREELLRMYYQCQMIHCAVRYKSELPTSTIINANNLFEKFDSTSFQHGIFPLDKHNANHAQTIFNRILTLEEDKKNPAIKYSSFAPKVDLDFSKSKNEITMDHINMMMKSNFKSLPAGSKSDCMDLFHDSGTFKAPSPLYLPEQFKENKEEPKKEEDQKEEEDGNI